MIITHGGGFFSCCSVRLYQILQYVNEHHALPDKVEFSGTFDLDFFFKENLSTITVVPWVNYGVNNLCDAQHFKFNTNEIISGKQFIQRYFMPTYEVQDRVWQYMKKYKIDPDNTCAVHFRGNDYRREANTGSYDDFVGQANRIKILNPKVRFLAISDENEFTDYFLKQVPGSFTIDEVRGMEKKDENYSFTLQEPERKIFTTYFLAAAILISQLKLIITNSGNCGMWEQLFRGHNRGVSQFYIDKFI